MATMTPEQRLAYLESLDAERIEALADAERLTAGMSQVASFRAANAAALMGHHALPAVRDLISQRDRVQHLATALEEEGVDPALTERLRAVLGGVR